MVEFSFIKFNGETLIFMAAVYFVCLCVPDGTFIRSENPAHSTPAGVSVRHITFVYMARNRIIMCLIFKVLN